MRGGKRWNLVSAVNNQIREEVDADMCSAGGPSIRSVGRRNPRSPQDPLEFLAARVSSKLEEGDFRVLSGLPVQRMSWLITHLRRWRP